MNSLERGEELVLIVPEDVEFLHLNNKSEDASFLSEYTVEVILKHLQIAIGQSKVGGSRFKI